MMGMKVKCIVIDLSTEQLILLQDFITTAHLTDITVNLMQTDMIVVVTDMVITVPDVMM
ncbi:MAG: hypothetical protein NVS1B13_21500 [Flavisolibacter sp.]